MIIKNNNSLIIDKSLFKVDMFWYDDEVNKIERVDIESITVDRNNDIFAMVVGDESLMMEVSWDMLAQTPEETIKQHIESNDTTVKTLAEEALKEFKERTEDATA